MWSLRDATYRGAYGENAAGQRRTDALVSYLLALTVRSAAYRKAWRKPELDANARCGACHALGRAKASGKPHRCAMLSGAKQVACSRLPCDPARGGGVERDQAHRRVPTGSPRRGRCAAAATCAGSTASWAHLPSAPALETDAIRRQHDAPRRLPRRQPLHQRGIDPGRGLPPGRPTAAPAAARVDGALPPPARRSPAQLRSDSHRRHVGQGLDLDHGGGDPRRRRGALRPAHHSLPAGRDGEALGRPPLRQRRGVCRAGRVDPPPRRGVPRSRGADARDGLGSALPRALSAPAGRDRRGRGRRRRQERPHQRLEHPGGGDRPGRPRPHQDAGSDDRRHRRAQGGDHPRRLHRGRARRRRPGGGEGSRRRRRRQAGGDR